MSSKMSCDVISKRLYIGGLSNGVSEDEITEKFARFGNITGLSLKRRHNPEGQVEKTFAHLNIEGKEDNITKCFTAYQNSKWKGATLTLQYAKASFLSKLDKEREEQKSAEGENNTSTQSPQVEIWQPPTFEIKGPLKPGAEVVDKEDWIVGKYGRVLPVLKLKKSSLLKVVKHDPSKLTHTTKVFKDDKAELPTDSSFTSLTWNIDKPDSEIVKKMKGEFPVNKSKKRKQEGGNSGGKEGSGGKKIHLQQRESVAGISAIKNNVPEKFESAYELEVVPILKHSSETNGNSEQTKSNRFDSDIEYSDSEDAVVSNKSKNKNLNNSITTKVSTTPKQTASNFDSDIEYNEAKETEVTSKNENKKLNTSTTKLPTSKVSTQKHNNNVNTPVVKFRGLSMLASFADNCITDSATEKTSIKQNGVINGSPQVKSISESVVLESPVCNNTDPQKKEKRKKKKSLSTSLEITTDSVIDSPSVKVQQNDIASKLLDTNSPSDKKDRKRNAKSKMEEIIEDKSVKCVENEAKSSPLPIKNVHVSVSSDSDSRSDQKDTKSPAAKNTKNQNTKYKSVKNVENVSSALQAKSKDVHESVSSDTDSHSDKKDVKNNVKTKTKSNADDKSAKSVDNVAKTNDTSIPSATSACNSSSNASSENPKKKPKKEKRKLKEDASSAADASEVVKKKKGQKNVELSSASKKLAANEKRLQAVRERQKVKEKQQQIMKEALDNVDSKINKKRIVFDSSDDGSDGDEKTDTKEDSNNNICLEQGSIKPLSKEAEAENKKDSGKALFDSSSEDSDSEEEDVTDMFKSRPHLEGKKGEKLMRLERRIGDSRFKLDAKFADSDESAEEEEEKETDEKKSEVDELQAEKEASLKVLEQVVGKSKLDQFSQKIKRNTTHIVDMNAMRFDPTKVSTPVPVKETLETGKKSKKEKESKSPVEKNDLDTSVMEDVEKTPASVLDTSSATESQHTSILVDSSTKKDSQKKKVKFADTAYQENNIETPVVSKAKMATSLLDMFKPTTTEADDDGGDGGGGGGFSLLDQFDKTDTSTAGDKGGSQESAGPLSALLKTTTTTAKTSTPKVNQETTEHEESSSSDSEDESSDVEEAKSESDEGEEDESDEEDESEEDDDKSNKKDDKQVSLPATNIQAKTKTTKLSSNVEDLFHTFDDSDEEHSGNDSDGGEKMDTAAADDVHVETDGISAELRDAGRVDIRYTKDGWKRRFAEIMPVLKKMYMHKSKRAAQNKMMERKEFKKKKYKKTLRFKRKK